MVVMGGEGFTPEQIMAAEARLDSQLVWYSNRCFAGNQDMPHTRQP